MSALLFWTFPLSFARFTEECADVVYYERGMNTYNGPQMKMVYGLNRKIKVEDIKCDIGSKIALKCRSG